MAKLTFLTTKTVQHFTSCFEWQDAVQNEGFFVKYALLVVENQQF